MDEDNDTDAKQRNIARLRRLNQRIVDLESERVYQAAPQLTHSLVDFQKDYPDPAKTAFIMMRFSNTKAHLEIAAAIKSTLAIFGIKGVRADEKDYHDDLFPNVQTYMSGCGFGIAVFERIEQDEFNPNVSLEVGYMLASGKPVCFLKDRNLKTLQTDLIGKLYKTFDPQNISETISSELTKWLQDRNMG